MRIADYIVETLIAHGIQDTFLVTGGAAMHLNDAFGLAQQNKKIKVTCCHHEQSCAMAAESYFRLTNRLAAVNVTAGPGAINALNGVFGAHVDSMGMVVISGQSKRATLVSSTELPLRQLGDQEVDIIAMVQKVTKYAVCVQDPQTICYHLEKALHLATYGRPGPVWLDIPIDVQATEIDPTSLKRYNPEEDRIIFETTDLTQALTHLLEQIQKAKKPVIYAGSGIRLSGQYETFLKLIDQMHIPVVTAWNSNDLLPDDHPCYAGRPGTVGNRAGNFTVQNADFLLVLGCRLNIRLISYNWESFAPQATIAMVDVDAAELKKPTLKVDFPIHADLRDLLPLMKALTQEWKPHHQGWLSWCRERLRLYPGVTPKMRSSQEGVNPYYFSEQLFLQLEPGEIIACADGTASVSMFQAAIVKEGERFFHNSGCASMGYDLPAAIGAAVAHPDKKRIICIAGDGSIMMNLQELATIAYHAFPIKIFILNNNGYHSIKLTQTNFFEGRSIGCDVKSGLGFPNFYKIANAFTFDYHLLSKHQSLSSNIKTILDSPNPSITEVFLDLHQSFEPKITSKKLPNGEMVTSSLEDMAPFLAEQELQENKYYD